jgi:hypothetical protein
VILNQIIIQNLIKMLEKIKIFYASNKKAVLIGGGVLVALLVWFKVKKK